MLENDTAGRGQCFSRRPSAIARRLGGEIEAAVMMGAVSGLRREAALFVPLKQYRPIASWRWRVVVRWPVGRQSNHGLIAQAHAASRRRALILAARVTSACWRRGLEAGGEKDNGHQNGGLSPQQAGEK